MTEKKLTKGIVYAAQPDGKEVFTEHRRKIS